MPFVVCRCCLSARDVMTRPPLANGDALSAGFLVLGCLLQLLLPGSDMASTFIGASIKRRRHITPSTLTTPPCLSPADDSLRFPKRCIDVCVDLPRFGLGSWVIGHTGYGNCQIARYLGVLTKHIDPFRTAYLQTSLSAFASLCLRRTVDYRTLEYIPLRAI